MNEIDWRAVGVVLAFLTAWTAFLGWIIKFLIERAVKGIDDKLSSLTSAQASTNGRLADLEKEFRALLTNLPTIYVHRDDWIRFSVALEARVERFGDKLDKLRELLTK